MISLNSKQRLQEDQYSFPYHHIPHYESGVLSMSRIYLWSHEYFTRINKVMEIILSSGKNRILDFGCGDGRFLGLLSAQKDFGALAGVDYSQKAISLARAMSMDENGNSPINWYSQLNDIKETFSIITAIEVLEHIDENSMPGIMEKLHSLLEDGGTFIVTVPTTVTTVNRKHFRHYDKSLLLKHTSPFFEIESVRYLCRRGFPFSLYKYIVKSPLATFQSRFFLNTLERFYIHFLARASEADGVCMVATLKKITVR